MRYWSRYGVNGALEMTFMNYELIQSFIARMDGGDDHPLGPKGRVFRLNQTTWASTEAAISICPPGRAFL